MARSGASDEVPVALFPTRDLVAGNRVHLHVQREQVVAALDLVAGSHLLEEELAVEPLPEQPPLHVGERDDDRVDRTGLDLARQLLESQHRGDPSASGRFVDMTSNRWR